MPSAFPARFTRLAEARGRFGDRVDRLGQYLMRADLLADAAVEAMDRLPPGVGWNLARTMALRGRAAVPEAPAALRALFAHAEHVPVWVDWSVVDRGGEVLLRAGPVGGLVLGLKSLVLSYTSPGGNKPLVFSGRLIERAPQRLLETARFVRASILPRGMRPHAPGWRMALQTRLIHARVRRLILASGRWDSAAWGLPISQHDEAGTSTLFSEAVLTGLRRFGMYVAPDEAEAYMHLWRWSGHVMGIDADLVPVTEGDAVRLSSLIRCTQGPPDDDSRALTRALLEGVMRGAGPEVAAARSVAIASALCRMLVGDTVADQLGVERTPWTRATPLVRQLVNGVDSLRRSVPFGSESALRAGRRYWDRVAEAGPGEGASDLALPAGLAA